MKLLITGAWREGEKYRTELERKGVTVYYQENDWDELALSAEEIEAVVCSRSFFKYHDISEMTSLKYVQVTSTGVDGLPVDYIEANGITLNTAGDVYAIPMAEQAVAAVLAIYRGLPTVYEQQKNKEWNKQIKVRELFASNVLIVGLGNAGSMCKERFNDLGCNVQGLHRDDDVNDYIADADIVILSTALTEQTAGIINEENIKKFKKDAILINLGRQELIEESLLAHISDYIEACVLDCFAEEPLPSDSPLWNTKGLYVQPHYAYMSPNNDTRLSVTILDHLSDVTGRQALYVVKGGLK